MLPHIIYRFLRKRSFFQRNPKDTEDTPHSKPMNLLVQADQVSCRSGWISAAQESCSRGLKSLLIFFYGFKDVPAPQLEWQGKSCSCDRLNMIEPTVKMFLGCHLGDWNVCGNRLRMIEVAVDNGVVCIVFSEHMEGVCLIFLVLLLRCWMSLRFHLFSHVHLMAS